MYLWGPRAAPYFLPLRTIHSQYTPAASKLLGLSHGSGRVHPRLSRDNTTSSIADDVDEHSVRQIVCDPEHVRDVCRCRVHPAVDSLMPRDFLHDYPK